MRQSNQFYQHCQSVGFRAVAAFLAILFFQPLIGFTAQTAYESTRH